MRLSSLLTSSQKVALKRVLYPLYRIMAGDKKVNTKYNMTEYGHPGCHTYFGYYDVTPFQGDRIIYLEREKNSDVCNVILNDLQNTSKQIVAESRAWNWQQGIRLRWFPKTENVISFNDYADGKYFNRIVNLVTKEEKKVDWPLYDIDSNGKFGLTLDFERLGFMRPGYGYTCQPYSAENLWDDGISIVDIEANCLIKTITYRNLSDKIKKAEDPNHFYLNHLAFSPDGTRFLFFWIDEMNGFHQASLGVYDIPSGTLIPLETEGKASHYVWDGNDEIVCTVLDKRYACGYYRYNVSSRTKTQICPVSLQCDGHPSIYGKGMLLTDTYPDKKGFQHIYLVNEKNDTKTELIKIYSIPMDDVERRTDLHPRLSADKRLVSFDSNHGGLRKMLVLEMEKSESV